MGKNLGVKYDRLLMFTIMALVAVGIVMVYSSSSVYSQERFGDQYFFIKKHLLMVALGLLAFYLGMKLNQNFLKKMSIPLLAISFSLLVFLIISKHGVLRSGAAGRWISLSIFSFQPSELAKLALVLFLAAYLSGKGENVRSFKIGFLPSVAVSGLFVLLIVMQPDFGTAVSVCTIAFVMLFAAGVRIKYLLISLVVALPAVLSLVVRSQYRLKRITAFADPWKDPLGSGFQMIQSFIAFSNGGLIGQGLGDGKQKLLYLPEAHTDFIFSVISEELGLVGVYIVVSLFALFIFKGLKFSLKMRDGFCSLLALGISSMVGLQAFLNIAVTMGLIPTKGLTLPFISYGGTSLIITLFASGILVNVTSNVNQIPSFNKVGRL